MMSKTPPPTAQPRITYRRLSSGCTGLVDVVEGVLGATDGRNDGEMDEDDEEENEEEEGSLLKRGVVKRGRKKVVSETTII